MIKWLKTGDLKNLISREALVIIIVVIFFLAASVASKYYAVFLLNIVEGRGAASIIIYVAIQVLATVIAPISAVPFLPIAVSIWGSFVTAFLSLLGWNLGAIIAFWLARRFGISLLGRVINIKKIRAVAGRIPEARLFWFAILFRIIFPVDILSYALGLFTNISWPSYLLATIIGTAPFAFIFSYGVNLPIIYQIIFGAILIILLFVYYNKIRADISSQGLKFDKQQS